jgi:hypothetical protein
LVLMYMRESQEPLPPIRIPLAMALVLFVTAVGTLWPGLFPSAWFTAAQESVRSIFS